MTDHDSTTPAGRWTNGEGPAHFRSAEELTAAMADSRYREDSNYRSELERKIVASGVLGIPLIHTQRT